MTRIVTHCPRAPDTYNYHPRRRHINITVVCTYYTLQTTHMPTYVDLALDSTIVYVLGPCSCSCVREVTHGGTWSGPSRMGVEVGVETGEEGLEITGSSHVVACVCVCVQREGNQHLCGNA